MEEGAAAEGAAGAGVGGERRSEGFGVGGGPVLLLQGGGGISHSDVRLSYDECEPGQFVVGLDCAPCPHGQFSTQFSAQTW